MKSTNKKELILIGVICVAVFFLSTLQVKDILSIWNQNDEFGTWQGGAWVLGLDWSEIVSTNGYYGHGYGFILAWFIKIWGNNTVLMTHMAIYFQALMHVGCIFIARYCILKLFPNIDAVTRIIASVVCVLNIPDLFYIYMFFSESILRVLVWIIVGLAVSYYDRQRWYKLLLIALVSVYAFSIHQRCILLVAMAILMIVIETFRQLKQNGIKLKPVIGIGVTLILFVAFYFWEYKYGQDSYINTLYSSGGNESVGGNLLSERGYTIKYILEGVVFNKEIEQIAFQSMAGMIYYFTAFDCGFSLFGFILCFKEIKRGVIEKKWNRGLLFGFILCLVLIGTLLVVYQNASGGRSDRVELLHYGRYCSHLFAPMMMLGIIYILTEKTKVLKRNTLIIVLIFLIAGSITYTTLKTNNITSLFAFSNACPGIRSVYWTENPYIATLYHTVLGVVWITIPIILICIAAAMKNKKKAILLKCGCFLVIAAVWIHIADGEWQLQHENQNAYVVQTYDLQNVLDNEEEFVAFKSFSYGSGLLQYNNPYSKIHVCQTLDDFNEEDDGLLVVSQKGIDEMDAIKSKYEVVYENERYFVWKYEIAKKR